MRIKTTLVIVLALVLALPVTVLAASGSRRDAQRSQQDDQSNAWIHVEVREAGQEAASVNINLPLALAQAALVATDGMVKEHMHFGGEGEKGGLTIADLRRIWKEAKKAGNAEFVTVESEGEKVRVYREGEFVHINVDATPSAEEQEEGEEGPEKVRIRMPIALVDALLSGEGEELNLTAAFDELEKVGPGEIVSVQDGSDVVRIWIDDQADNTD